MSPLRVLITNITLATSTGTETFVRDLARGLLRSGHTATVYSPDLGPIADELRSAGFVVADELVHLAPPDVIHGHHALPTLTALARFPGVPAVYLVHDRRYWIDEPPRHPRIRRYAAVDEACRERVTAALGIDAGDVALIPNAVDLDRFRPRAPLPPRPARALVFSNYASERDTLPVIRASCQRRGIALDAIGAAAGHPCARPEDVLGRYDVVFAKGRCALEALAVGCAVVVCDVEGVAGLVGPGSFDHLRRLNFGRAAFREAVSEEALSRALDDYDPAAGTAVSARVREAAGLERQIDQLTELYREAVAAPGEPDLAAERAAEAAVMSSLLPRLGEWQYLQGELERLRALERRAYTLEAANARLEEELSSVRASTTIRLRNRVVALPMAGGLARRLARLAGGAPAGDRSAAGERLEPMPIIVGAPRSGTTLLRLMLDSHSELAIPPETGWLGAAAMLPEQGADPRESLLALILGAPQWADVHIDPEHLRRAFARLRPFTPAAGVRAFYRLYAGRFGNPCWGEKTPGDAEHLEAIARLLPEARFVHLIRDGRDVAVSTRPLWFAAGSSPESLARDWSRRVSAARLSGARCPHYLEIRFEELVTRTSSALRDVCRFLTLPFEPQMEEYHIRAAARLAEHGPQWDPQGRRVISREERLAQQRLVLRPPDPSRIGRWRTEMSAEDRRRFEAIAGPLLWELGYPPR